MPVLVAAGAGTLAAACVAYKYIRGSSAPVPVLSAAVPVLSEAGKKEAESLLASLSNASVGSLVAAAGGTRWCFRQTKDVAVSKTSFVPLDSETTGEEAMLADHGVAYSCRKGLKPESPNQDRAFVLVAEGIPCIYGGVDGHGQTGHFVAQLICDTLVKLILKDERLKSKNEAAQTAMLKDVFRQMQLLLAHANDKKTTD
eukprot:TRINITY_DN34601_c0_g1_i2.p1 TRINITY_DN34601_c0_g1~~TRINITY_DN34601_c0_g1_i2.p1  ORF type:complete len:200 (-),score=35.53 TRINITY_DN34601_c0_g1_i2:435-1034(-)